MPRFSFAAGVALLALAFSLPAATVRADHEECRGFVGATEAIAIAWSVGLVRVEKVECDDDEWEVEGRDAWGREMEVEISSRSGRVLKVDRDD